MSSDSVSAGERKNEIRERHREAAEAVVPENRGLFIGGEFVDSASGETFETRDPTTGEVLAEVQRGNAEDVDRAVEAAWEAYDEEWSGYDAAKRQKTLNAVADAIEAEVDAFAKLESLDNGKPIREAKGDMYAVVDQFRYFAGVCRHDEGITLPADDTRSMQTIHEPYGVVGAITPWNFPLLIATWKLAPALAAGNCVVLKPAEQTPLSALKLCEVVQDVLPDGVLNVVTGYGEEAGEPLTTHADVPKLTFTGSTPVGKHVMKNAADRVADVNLELGGKSPVVVHPDANLKAAARNAFIAIFYNKGECCTAGSRMFIHEDVYDEFIDQLVGVAENSAVGDPLDTDNSIGPKVDDEQVERVLEYIELAKAEGGTFLAGGGTPEDEALEDGSFVEPTIIEGLDHDSRPVQEEIFGPVLEVFEWSEYDDMIELANDVDFGLAAGIMTENVKKAMQTAKDLEAGTIWVNQYNDFPSGMPFGGIKQSGTGRETAFQSMRSYQTTKAIDISLR